jgi:hypothetical protein
VRQLGEAARQLIAEGHPDSEQISVRLAQVKVIEVIFYIILSFLDSFTVSLKIFIQKFQT